MGAEDEVSLIAVVSQLEALRFGSDALSSRQSTGRAAAEDGSGTLACRRRPGVLWPLTLSDQYKPAAYGRFGSAELDSNLSLVISARPVSAISSISSSRDQASPLLSGIEGVPQT